ncbi:MAG TPA: hypothetical protein VJS89_01890 [Gammaproteobacteria bacterium]|nr:hypothetical protein [Gammaproteobacteria bacterium]
MRRIFTVFSIGLAVALLAACASTPQQRFASSVKAAQAANRPLVVYLFEHVRRRVFEPVPFPSAKKFDTYVGMGIINTAAQPIQQVVFNITDYRGDHPVLNGSGDPLNGKLVAIGPFVPGRSYGIVSKTPIWSAVSVGNDGCPRVTGIEVTYQNGSRVAVPAETVRSYLTPQINVNCASYPGYIQGPEDLRFGNINGPIGSMPQHASAGGKPDGGR